MYGSSIDVNFGDIESPVSADFSENNLSIKADTDDEKLELIAEFEDTESCFNTLFTIESMDIDTELVPREFVNAINAADVATAKAYEAANKIEQRADSGEFIPGFEIGTVTTIPHNHSAKAEISGTNRNPVLNLAIPRGLPGDGTEGGFDFTVDETLNLTLDNVLSVNTANDATQDNTLPITSGAVFSEIGNINALLSSI